MSEPPKALSAIDVIRCVYLARETLRRGQTDAAARWAAKADRWLRRQQSRAPAAPGPMRPGPPP